MMLIVKTEISKFISLIFVLLLVSSHPAIAQPKLAIQGGTNLDFGEIYTGMKFVKDLSVYNIGTDTLVVRNVSASCGCTAVLLKQNRIPPHDSSSLAITFNSSQYSGMVAKSITFTCNDPEQKDVRIVFKANVIKVFDLAPEYVVFRTTIDSIPMDTVLLKNASPFPVKILSTSSSMPEVKATPSTDALKPGETAYIQLAFTPKTVGTIKGDLTIKTDNEHMQTLDVRYFGLVLQKGNR